MRPVCVKCGIEMKRIKSGVVALTQFQNPPQPYQAFMADLFECPDCQNQVLSGYGDKPCWQHFEGTEPPTSPLHIIDVREN